jgi:hypothetical protein
MMTLLTVFWLWPNTALAHVQWFVDADHTNPVDWPPFRLTEPVVLLALTCVIGLVLLLALIHNTEEHCWRRLKISVARRQDLHRFGCVVVALTLLYFSYHEKILLPDFPASGNLGALLLGLQMAAALFFLVNPRAGASLLLVLCLAACAASYPWYNLLHYYGIALYCWLLPWRPRLAVGMLAALVGSALIALALVEKLLQPELAGLFLLDHEWNFMAGAGVDWFTDRYFILFTGLVELTLGFTLAVGIAPRLTSALLLVVFVMTALLLGWHEVVGHAPIIAAVLFYLTETSCLRPWSIAGG